MIFLKTITEKCIIDPENSPLLTCNRPIGYQKMTDSDIFYTYFVIVKPEVPSLESCIKGNPTQMLAIMI